jgi:hypothetical protein
MRALLALLMLTTALSAHAVDYCVGTLAQLKQALLDAQSDGDTSVIKLRKGVYVLDESLSYGEPNGRIDGGLTLRGGYGTNCESLDTSAVGTTIAGTSTLALTLVNERQLTVQSLTFLGLDVQLRACTAVDPLCTLLISRIRGQTNQTAITLSGGSGVLRDSLFTTGQNGLALTAHMPESQSGLNFFAYDLEVINISVVDALTRFTGGSIVSGEDREVDIRNSSFSRTAATEIETNRDIQLRFSRYDSLSATNDAVVLASNNTSLQPNFNAQFVPNPGSPLIDRGTASVEGGLSRDVYNEPRVIGQAVDIGAAESPVDGSGIFVVDTTAASGNGSLAAAIAFANADDGPNQINFDIPGSCPKRINRSSALIVTDGLVIDGYSQPGSVRNTGNTLFNAQPCIILSGSNRTHDGIVGGSELSTKNEGIRIQGLAFENFADALDLDEGLSHVIQGNQFGGTIGNLSGTDAILAGNDVAISLNRLAAQFATIGGAELDEKNLIVGTALGIRIGSDNNTVSNNQIGYDRLGAGSSTFNNTNGVAVTGASNLLVGNRFGKHSSDAVRISGAGARFNRVQSNSFGGLSLQDPPANERNGVHLFSDANNNRIWRNTFIANRVGVRVAETAGGRNRIDENGMAEQTGLGIDLGALGVTPNDVDPSLCDTNIGCASNGEQNYPALSQARFQPITPLGRPLQVSGSLRSLVRSQPYRLAFFVADRCNSSGHGEGARLLDSTDLTIVTAGFCQGSNCSASFSSFIAAEAVLPNQYLTATATSPNGDTSEFSACERILASDLIFTDGFE